MQWPVIKPARNNRTETLCRHARLHTYKTQVYKRNKNESYIYIRIRAKIKYLIIIAKTVSDVEQ